MCCPAGCAERCEALLISQSSRCPQRLLTPEDRCPQPGAVTEPLWLIPAAAQLPVSVGKGTKAGLGCGILFSDSKLLGLAWEA